MISKKSINNTTGNPVRNSADNATGNSNFANNATNHPFDSGVSFGRLVWEAIRHNQILVVLSVLGSFLASPVYYVYFMSINSQYIGVSFGSAGAQTLSAAFQARSALSYMTSFLRRHQFFHTIVLTAGAILVAFVGFRHLFHRRMTDLYHSMPVTRNRLFLAQYLAGFLIWFVPFFVGDLIVLTGGCIRCAGTPMPSVAGEYAVIWLKMTVLLVFAFLIVYHLALPAVMISGNVFNAIANLLLLGLLVTGAYFLQLLYLSSFMDTYLEMQDLKLYSVLAGLTPLITPVAFCAASLADVAWNWLLLLLCSGVLCLMNFCLAMYLHRRRRSEASEGGMESPVLRTVFRFAISIICGLLTTLLFGYLIEYNGGHQTPWLLFGGILGTIVSFCVMNVVYHADFKAVFAHKIQLFLCVLAVCCTVLTFRYDIFGYDTYVPRESDITGLSLSGYSHSDSSYGIHMYKDGSDVFYVDADYQAALRSETISTDPALIHKALTALAHTQSTENEKIVGYQYSNLVTYGGLSYSIEVRVDTKYGSYYREYSGLGREEMEALAPLLRADRYLAVYYPASSGQLPDPDAVNLIDLEQRSIMLTDKDRIHEFYAAYVKDFKTQYPLWDPFYHPYSGNLYYFNFIYHTNPDPNRSHVTDMRMWDSFTETTALLQKWYPEYTWSPEDIDISALQIDFTLPESLTIEEYLGLDDSAGAQEKTAYELQTYDGPMGKKRSYSLLLTDPQKLAALRPYLRLKSAGIFYDEDHVYIGQAFYYAVNGEHNFQCYLELGKMPAELLAELKTGEEN